MQVPFREISKEDCLGRMAFRPREAAAVLGVSESTLNRLTEKGDIACIKLDRAKLIARSEIERWLAQATEASREEFLKPVSEPKERT